MDPPGGDPSPHTTANLFGVPNRCHYGVRGSPGFGAWRELAANQIVTAAVLAGTPAAGRRHRGPARAGRRTHERPVLAPLRRRPARQYPAS